MPKLTARLIALVALGGLISPLGLLAPGSALASGRQTSLLEEDDVAQAPVPVLQELRHLGVGELRLLMRWTQLAPNPDSSRRPQFDAADPAAYPSAGWAQFDNAVRQAQADGIKVLITLTGHAPVWAFGRGEPGGSLRPLLGAWKPSASEFGRFFTAVARRYSGHYSPPGSHSPLPAVDAWEIYNEPNFGESLSPQSQGAVYTSAVMYRGLVSAAWRALKSTGHGHDMTLIDSLAARGQDRPNIIGETPPLDFVRELYCLDRRFHPFRGAAARRHSCPSSSSAFRRQNPGLFSASAVSVHPYPLGPDGTVPPNRTRTPNPNYAALSQLPTFLKGLDRALRADGSGRRFPLWNTEYGYISNPPNRHGTSLTNQATFLNWAEYLSWKNPRLESFMQFLLLDPSPTVGVPEFGGFSSGLLFFPSYRGGAAKPALGAWRLPLFLPSTATRTGHSLEVWGCVRPGSYAFNDTHQAQVAQLQFKARGSSSYRTLAAVPANRNCYFDRQITFPSSGTVRLAYTYPAGDLRLRPTFATGPYIDPLAPYFSRTIPVTVH